LPLDVRKAVMGGNLERLLGDVQRQPEETT